MKKRVIAINLPQFHPFPENDEWWGKGFTEWTNVTSSRPRFHGHYQPQLPTDTGFYDLRLPEARQMQADMAKEYGIYGFCYYHYWFNGKQLMERPVKEILSSGEPDFPFMLCWANENWARNWDGGFNKVLIAQNYSEEDDIAHMKYLCEKVFPDERYIKVDGKPVFCIYRPHYFPDMAQTIKTWREVASSYSMEIEVNLGKERIYFRDYFKRFVLQKRIHLILFIHIKNTLRLDALKLFRILKSFHVYAQDGTILLVDNILALQFLKGIHHHFIRNGWIML